MILPGVIAAGRRIVSAPPVGSFPQLLSTTVSTFDATRVIQVQMPATVAAGDLLLMVVNTAGNPSLVSSPSGWTLAHTRNASGNQCVIRVFTKVATGSEGGTTAPIDLFPADSRAAQVFRIAAGSYAGSAEIASSAPSNNQSEHQLPTLTPSGGAGAYLWIAAVGGGYAANVGAVTAFPYPGGNIETIAGTGQRAMLASCWKESVAASETPGLYQFAYNVPSAGLLIGIKGA